MGGLDRLYDRQAATSPGLLYPTPANPSKAQPSPQATAQAPPVATVVRQNPPVLTYQVTQTVELRQPGCVDRAIAAVGLRLCQRGLPRPRITSAHVSGFGQSPATVTYTVTAAAPPPTYASPQR